MTIKSFRGEIATEATVKINLRTNDGKTGYRIIKLQMMPDNPGTSDVEHVIKIFAIEQTGTPTNQINFSDQDLLASGYLVDSNSVGNTSYLSTVFDNVIFNQDIFIEHKEALDNQPCNYYLELEQIKLNDNETTMATLQSIRSSYESQSPAGPS